MLRKRYVASPGSWEVVDLIWAARGHCFDAYP